MEALRHGAPLGINKDTLWRRLKEAGLLALCSPGRNMHDKKIAGQKRKLIALTLPIAMGIGVANSENAADAEE